MRRASAKREPFFLGFVQGNKKTLHEGLDMRLLLMARLFHKLNVIDNHPTIPPCFRTLLPTALNSHTAKASPDGSCARTRNSQPFVLLFAASRS